MNSSHSLKQTEMVILCTDFWISKNQLQAVEVWCTFLYGKMHLQLGRQNICMSHLKAVPTDRSPHLDQQPSYLGPIVQGGSAAAAPGVDFEQLTQRELLLDFPWVENCVFSTVCAPLRVPRKHYPCHSVYPNSPWLVCVV